MTIRSLSAIDEAAFAWAQAQAQAESAVECRAPFPVCKAAQDSADEALEALKAEARALFANTYDGVLA